MTFESSIAAPQQGAEPLRALCIARHCFLSEHIARYFAQMGVATTNAVGLDCAVGTAAGSAVGSAGEASPDVVICDYDLLASIPLEIWEQDGLLSRIPVIAVSLTRNAEELHLFDVNGIAGFLYLPTLQQASALKILHAAASRSRYTLTSGITAPRTRERS
jgi:DNA-binding NarL/FixJ family response regulator